MKADSRLITHGLARGTRACPGQLALPDPRMRSGSPLAATAPAAEQGEPIVERLGAFVRGSGRPPATAPAEANRSA
jgi:hypothetical protein